MSDEWSVQLTQLVCFGVNIAMHEQTGRRENSAGRGKKKSLYERSHFVVFLRAWSFLSEANTVQFL